MKKIKSLVLFLSLFVAVSSCKKSDSGTTPTSGASITLKVDGAAKTSTSQVAILYTSLNSFQLIAQIGTVELLNISINNLKVGTFNTGGTDAILSYSTDATFANTFLGTTGTVTVTSLTSDTIVGTFQFTGTNASSLKTKVISEGSFNCKYSKQ